MMLLLPAMMGAGAGPGDGWLVGCGRALLSERTLYDITMTAGAVRYLEIGRRERRLYTTIMTYS